MIEWRALSIQFRALIVEDRALLGECTSLSIEHRCLSARCSSAMGWLRLVGFLKFHVSFAKEPYKRDYVQQKRPIISRSLRSVATPYAELNTEGRDVLIDIGLFWLEIGPLRLEIDARSRAVQCRARLSE